MNYLLSPFVGLIRKTPILEVAQNQLDEAQHLLLRHQASAEYHTRMVEYCVDTIERLRGFKTVAPITG